VGKPGGYKPAGRVFVVQPAVLTGGGLGEYGRTRRYRRAKCARTRLGSAPAPSSCALTLRQSTGAPSPSGGGENKEKRTLTKLYNLRPTWLELAHQKLDKAVLAAYGWEEEINDEEILARLLALNLERAARQEEK